MFKLNIDDPKITKRLLFIPIVVYFLATGAYPGNLISSLFIIPVFLSLQIVHAYTKVKCRALKVGAVMTGLLILGISISVVHLGPIWQEKGDLTRFTNYASQQHAGLSVPHVLASLFMSDPGGDFYVLDICHVANVSFCKFYSCYGSKEILGFTRCHDPLHSYGRWGRFRRFGGQSAQRCRYLTITVSQQ